MWPRRIYFGMTGLLLLGAFAVPAGDFTEEELERWFNSKSTQPPDYRKSNVGELEFLTNVPNIHSLYHHQQRITILADSPKHGWVEIRQCHYQLDKVAAAEIVFNNLQVRDINITNSKNIERVWIEGTSVQLKNITADASICVHFMSQALRTNDDGSFSMRNGPYMRRFFDSYFPMRVSIDVDFSKSGLVVQDYQPSRQAGFEMQHRDGILHVDSVFAGRLLTHVHFIRPGDHQER